jgi:hypothetical protein
MPAAGPPGGRPAPASGKRIKVFLFLFFQKKKALSFLKKRNKKLTSPARRNARQGRLRGCAAGCSG